MAKKTQQLNVRVDPEKVGIALQELKEMDISQGAAVTWGILKAHEYVKSINPTDARLALKV